MGYNSQIVLNGRIANDSLGVYATDVAVKKMIEAGLAPKKSKDIIIVLTFKENYPDCWNSKVAGIISRLGDRSTGRFRSV